MSARILDRLLAGQGRLPAYWAGEPPPPSIHDALESSTAVFADNVVSYMFESMDKEEWNAEDFPSLVPPFDPMWIETRSPKFIDSRGELKPIPPTMPTGFGALFMSAVDERPGMPWRWEIHAMPFEEYRGGQVIGPMGVCSLRVRSDGTWPNASQTDMNWARAAIMDGGTIKDPVLQSRARDILWWRVKPLLLAISFMNCRNVSRVLERPNDSLSRKWERKRGRPLVRGYTLNIEPMRAVLKSEGRSGELGLQKALHICRGHFKDYREGGGLFGKHKGLYWWDANVRGGVESGIVAKDYAVHPPRGGHQR